jgi:hypothetical protein
VRSGDDVYNMEIDRDDWSPDKEILKEVGAELGAVTVGDVFHALEKQGKVVKAFPWVESSAQSLWSPGVGAFALTDRLADL